MQGGTLALDLATVTGWAYGAPGAQPAPTTLELASGDKPSIHTSGSIRLAGQSTDPVRKWIGIRDFLNDQIILNKPKFVVYEAPYVGGKKTNQDVARMLFGLTSQVEVVCYDNGIKCFETNITKVRKYFCGNAPRDRKKAKNLVEQRCADLGWHYENDDESDALAVLDYALSWLAQRNMLPEVPEQVDF